MSGRRKLDCIGDYCYDKKDILGHGAFAIVFKGCKKHVSLFSVAFILCCRQYAFSDFPTILH